MTKQRRKIGLRSSSPALTIVLLFGVVSMLGDLVHESARSVNGQYLSLVGLSATQVGLVFGLGEFLGYALRLLSGAWLDKSKRYWLFLFIGYGVHLVIPLMGLTTSWGWLYTFILLERIGKALRSPAKDTILSAVAENQIGLGYAFGIQEALDQLGAFLGPLIFTALFYFVGSSGLEVFQLGYQLLVIPFIILMVVLALVHRKFVREKLTPEVDTTQKPPRLQPIFWIYSAFTFFVAFGLINFSLIGYHLKTQQIVSDGMVPILYAVAMAVDALVAIFIGKGYDRLKRQLRHKTGGVLILLIVPLLTAFVPLLTLSHSVSMLWIGMVLMGVVLGAHETVMRSAIADITPFSKRGIGFGIFNTVYGLSLLLGSLLMGWLYDLEQQPIIVAMTIISEGAAVALYVVLYKRIQRERVSN
ncbi:MFS transporter [uncultured Porphyromonas sp.]|uniref:MFS transporter n=1 Tax=uncultured Porphyromonas sp. TaxID=159274 RepID=UPI002804A988|nr:MFS transporter [uncultured Porphyromonas sp.]